VVEVEVDEAVFEGEGKEGDEGGEDVTVAATCDIVDTVGADVTPSVRTVRVLLL